MMITTDYIKLANNKGIRAVVIKAQKELLEELTKDLILNEDDFLSDKKQLTLRVLNKIRSLETNNTSKENEK